MDESLLQAVALLEGQRTKHLRAANESARAINAIYLAAGEPPKYQDSELEESSAASLSIQSDEFYGQPLAASIRKILEIRRGMKQGPATVNELYDSLLAGGFKFETKNEENAKRGLRISLTKNTITFHKLPNGRFGLLEWYPNAKPAQPPKPGSKDEEVEDEDATEGKGAAS